MESDQEMLSVGDAAKRLERSTEQVRRYLREGRLNGRRIGGQWFIDRSVLDAFASAAKKQHGFVNRLRRASAIRPLDDVIGIGSGSDTNIADGKVLYRATSTRRR
jgi:excisionase family DNA binding protein